MVHSARQPASCCPTSSDKERPFGDAQVEGPGQHPDLHQSEKSDPDPHLTLIRSEGNDAHNIEVLGNGRGELLVARFQVTTTTRLLLCLAMSACCGSLKRG